MSVAIDRDMGVPSCLADYHSFTDGDTLVITPYASASMTNGSFTLDERGWIWMWHMTDNGHGGWWRESWQPVRAPSTASIASAASESLDPQPCGSRVQAALGWMVDEYGPRGQGRG